MLLLSFLRNGLLLLIPLSITLTTYLYLYPLFHGCAFPLPDTPGASDSSQFLDTLRQNGAPISRDYLATLRQHVSLDGGAGTAVAPFRLLALGDPQLEGDTSLPDPDAFPFPNLYLTFSSLTNTSHNPLRRVRSSLHALIDLLLADIPSVLDGYRKRLDLVGNDYYLAHIYRTVHWWTRPTHVSVLGDLVGSQWISDDEFTIRSDRFWSRVFKGGLRVPDNMTDCFVHGTAIQTHNLGEDAELWTKRVINIAGNHDVGYAGDLTPARFERFEKAFGRANYELRFRLPPDGIGRFNGSAFNVERREVPELRIVVLNDMNLDTPAGSKDLQDATYRFLNDMINASPDVARPALFTLLLTHIPLHKKAGICVDAPYFAFHDSEEFAYGVREQNHLSDAASRGLLEGIFGMSGDKNGAGKGIGRHGMIVTGHDHEGCDVYHYIDQTPPETAEVSVEEAGLPDVEAAADGQVTLNQGADIVEATEPESPAQPSEDKAETLDQEVMQATSTTSEVSDQAETDLASSASQESSESDLSNLVSETDAWDSSTTPPYATESDNFSSFGPTPTLDAEPSVSSSESLSNEAEAAILVREADLGPESEQSSLSEVISPLASDSEWSIPFINDLNPIQPSESSDPSSDAAPTSKNEFSIPFIDEPEPTSSPSQEPEPSRPDQESPPSPPEPWKPEWSVLPYAEASRHTSEQTPLPLLRHSGIPGIREVTLRSMMGEFSGHAGLISLWFDPETWEWKSEVADCGLGKQHWWWIIHIIDLITLGGIILWGIFTGIKEVVGCELVVRVPGEEWVTSWLGGVNRQESGQIKRALQTPQHKAGVETEEVELSKLRSETDLVDVDESEEQSSSEEESGEEYSDETYESEESEETTEAREQRTRVPETPAPRSHPGYLRLVPTPNGTSKELRRVALPNPRVPRLVPAQREQEPTPEPSLSGIPETPQSRLRVQHPQSERRLRGSRSSGRTASEENSADTNVAVDPTAAPVGGYQGPHERYAKYIYLTDLTGPTPKHLQVQLPSGWNVRDTDRERSVPGSRDEIQMQAVAPEADPEPARRRVRAAKIIRSIENQEHGNGHVAAPRTRNGAANGNAVRESSFYTELQKPGNRTLKGHEFYGNGNGNGNAGTGNALSGNDAGGDRRERRRSPRLASGSVFEP